MSATPQDATVPPPPAAVLARRPDLPPRETGDLIRSVQALRLFAELHGHLEAELLVRDLLDEISAGR